MKKYLYIIIISFLIIMSGCALQSDVIYTDNRVDAIEKKVAKQKREAGDAEKAFRVEYAKLNNRVENLDEKFRQVEGRLEELSFAFNSQKEIISVLQKQNEKLDLTSSSLSGRIKNLEAYTDYEPSYNTKSQNKNESSPLNVKKDSDLSSGDLLLYEKAKNAFDKDDLKTARKLFSELIKTFPGSDKADNAQFWIGESYYKSKWYSKAILEYQKVIDDFPKSNKLAGAYLKQGLAFAVLGEAENAEIVLKEVIKKFPDSGEAVIARKKLADKGK